MQGFVDIVYSKRISAGSPYEMGEAHGQLQKEKAAKFMNSVWEYLEQQIVSS